MTRYVVTGGAGFIGHTLVNRLVAAGHSVVVIDNERSGNWSRVGPNAEQDRRGIEEFSFADWQERLRGVDVLFHLAAEKYNSSNSTPERVLDVNLIATDRLFRAASGLVSKVVFTSSLYAYGSMGPDAMRESDVPSPTTHYGLSKLAGEHLLRSISRNSQPNWTVARLFFIYGPSQFAEGGYKSVITSNFERMIQDEAAVVRGDGLQSLDYVYVEDCVDALVRLTEHDVDGEVFNVASGASVDILELTKLMREIAGDARPIVYAEPDWTNGSHRVGDPSHITSITGWSAKTPIKEGLGRVWDWMQSNA